LSSYNPEQTERLIRTKGRKKWSLPPAESSARAALLPDSLKETALAAYHSQSESKAIHPCSWRYLAFTRHL
jgi:hypothetical protein